MSSLSNCFSPEEVLDFRWCFKPILGWIRLTMGIDLLSSRRQLDGSSCSNGKVLCNSIVRFLFGLSMLCFTILVDMSTIYFFYKNLTLEIFLALDGTFTQANLLLINITAANDTIENTLVHIVLFVYYLIGKWQSLWFVLDQIELQFSNIGEQFFRRCRKSAILGLLFILVSSALNVKLAVDLNVPNQFWANIMGCLMKLTEIVVISVWILFYIIILSVGHLFRYLNSTILQLGTIQLNKSTIDSMTDDLERWRRRHALVCQLVEEVSSFFGVILLLSVTHSFVNFIVNTFEITNQRFNFQMGLIFLGRFSLNILRFSTICYGCSLVESEASRTILYLRQLNFDSFSPDHQLLLNRIKLEVGLTNPKITAAGFFDVNLGLFPSLMSTTLTYVIVIWDQKWSERSGAI